MLKYYLQSNKLNLRSWKNLNALAFSPEVISCHFPLRCCNVVKTCTISPAHTRKFFFSEAFSFRSMPYSVCRVTRVWAIKCCLLLERHVTFGKRKGSVFKTSEIDILWRRFKRNVKGQRSLACLVLTSTVHSCQMCLHNKRLIDKVLTILRCWVFHKSMFASARKAASWLNFNSFYRKSMSIMNDLRVNGVHGKAFWQTQFECCFDGKIELSNR